MTDILCPQCGEEPGIQDREYGILPGEICQAFNSEIPKPTQAHSYDFASQTTKEQRKSYGDEMFQPYINGVLSKEFIEVYGTDKLHGVTKKDMKNAKYVYGGMTRHHRMVENGVKKEQARFKNPDDYKVIEGKLKG